MPYSYIDWDITRDELKTLWSDILYGRADMHRKISVTATYGTYTDIKDEIHSMNVLQFHPGISNIKFKPVEMVDDEYFELSRDKDVLVAYRHYTYENSQGESEWSCETIR